MKKKVNKYVVFAIVAFFLGSLFPFAYSGVDTGLDQLKILVDVMSKIQDSYVDQTNPKDLIKGALYGMVSRLDQFSEFIDAEDMARMREETKGEFGGVGMRLNTPKDGVLIVVTPMKNTPAYKAGVEPGDKVVKIDGKEVKDLKSDDAVSMLRGIVGTKVKIETERKGADGKIALKKFTLKREIIVPEVIFSRMLDKNVGYIYVADFSGHTNEDFETALNNLSKRGMKSLVIDLRFNPGGLLDSAVDMMKMFVGENKLIVYTKGRKQEFFKEYRSDSKAKYENLPVAVLINEGSASGSEIVAGAFQDYKRATLIGRRSFGKGSVQQVMMLPDGSGLRITVAKYYTPKGRMIHKNFKAPNPNLTGGIVPDIEVPFDLNEEQKAIYYTTNYIYSPSAKTAKPEMTGKFNDPVLNKAVEVLTAPKPAAPAQTPAAAQPQKVQTAK